MKKANFQRKFQKNRKNEGQVKLGYWEERTKIGRLLPEFGELKC